MKLVWFTLLWRNANDASNSTDYTKMKRWSWISSCCCLLPVSLKARERELFDFSRANLELGHPSAADTAKSLNSLAQCSCWAVLCCVLPKYAICAWKWRASAPVRSIFTTIIAIIIIIVPIYFSFVLYSWDMLFCSWWGCYIGRQCNVGICGDGKQRSIGDNERMIPCIIPSVDKGRAPQIPHHRSLY